LVLFLKILGGLAALALGIHLGGGRFTQSPDEVAARLGKGQPRKAKRHFMWLNWLKATPRGSERRRGRQPFKTAVARDKSGKAPRD
jgi:hypothetical protein